MIIIVFYFNNLSYFVNHYQKEAKKVNLLLFTHIVLELISVQQSRLSCYRENQNEFLDRIILVRKFKKYMKAR